MAYILKRQILNRVGTIKSFIMKKIKLSKLDVKTLSEKEISKVFGGSHSSSTSSSLDSGDVDSDNPTSSGGTQTSTSSSSSDLNDRDGDTA